MLDGSGAATPQFMILPIPQLVNLTVNFACVTIDPPAPGGIGAVSNLVSITIQP